MAVNFTQLLIWVIYMIIFLISTWWNTLFLFCGKEQYYLSSCTNYLSKIMYLYYFLIIYTVIVFIWFFLWTMKITQERGQKVQFIENPKGKETSFLQVLLLFIWTIIIIFLVIMIIIMLKKYLQLGLFFGFLISLGGLIFSGYISYNTLISKN